MCDTFVAMPDVTEGKAVLFAKNSDRDPNEPHQMIYVPAARHTVGDEVYATYVSVPQVAHTNAVMLFKPCWIWGCEMGVNEHGLVIGNEAVFTRNKYEGETLIGMDYVRLALERASTAREGVEVITHLLGLYGQGGNCAYSGKMVYDNSYLLADRDEAWVLETAGRLWAARRVEDTAAISNCLSIDTEYDLVHPHAAEYAEKCGWQSKRRPFSFRNAFSDRLYTAFAKGDRRRESVLRELDTKKGSITPQLMREILRMHPHDKTGRSALGKSSMASVCMHGGGAVSSHTAGSIVVEIGKEVRLWVTGASTPCFSAFKPLWFSPDAPVFREHQEDESNEYWLRRERLFRAAMAGKLDIAAYTQGRDALEAVLDSLVGSKKEIMKDAFAAEQHFVETAAEQYKADARPVGGAAIRRYWKKHSASLETVRKRILPPMLFAQD